MYKRQVLQDPKFSLNPIMRVGLQIVEALRIGSSRITTKQARAQTLAMLEAVQILSLIHI